MKLTTKN